MTFEVIPEGEVPQVLNAVRSGSCVVCYEPTEPEHFLYCHKHDECTEDCPLTSPGEPSDSAPDGGAR